MLMAFHGTPAAAVSIEAPGANAVGVYHNAGGKDVSALEAKTDLLWAKLREMNVPTVSIGDLGNEIGMGRIAGHIRTYVPFTDKGECSCGCKGGILAASTTDCIITATCSDWGCYGLMAAIAYLKRDIDILQTEEMEAELMRAAARCGLIDMTGSLLPGIDGFEVCRRIRATNTKIGIIMLIGLVAKNGILIVEFANQKQEAGLDKMRAIEEASLQRLRPILMTSASTILGLLPLTVATGEGANGRIAMGIAVVGGMIVSTFLTLFIVPAMYSFISTDRQSKINNQELKIKK